MNTRGFDALRKKTRFIFVRHGQSEGNAQGIFQGKLDLPLTEQGRNEARRAGVWLQRERRIDAILTSPLIRAEETARIVHEALLVASPTLNRPMSDALLEEIDTGSFSGMSPAAAEAAYPEAFRAFQELSWEAVPGAESIAEVQERARAVWARLGKEAGEGGKDILCVTHGGFIQWLFKTSVFAECSSWMPVIDARNCSLWELAVQPLAEANPGRSQLRWTLLNFVAP